MPKKGPHAEPLASNLLLTPGLLVALRLRTACPLGLESPLSIRPVTFADFEGHSRHGHPSLLSPPHERGHTIAGARPSGLHPPLALHFTAVAQTRTALHIHTHTGPRGLLSLDSTCLLVPSQPTCWPGLSAASTRSVHPVLLLPALAQPFPGTGLPVSLPGLPPCRGSHRPSEARLLHAGT